MAVGRHREAIVRAAAQLFRRHGYEATGLADIVAASGAPKGSVYHYFPGGKEEIAAAAIAFAGDQVTQTLTRLAAETTSAADIIESYALQLARWMSDGHWTMGCPIATVLLEIAPNAALATEKGRQAFAAWSEVISGALQNDGVEPKRARALSDFAIAAIEGALIRARVEQSELPLVESGIQLARLFDAEARFAR